MVWLGRLIVIVGCGLWIAAIGYAGLLGIQQEAEPDLGEYLPTVLTSLGGALATVFGAAFGISGRDPFIRASLLAPRFNFPATATLLSWAYFVGLLVGVGFFIGDADKANAAQPIRDIWKTLLGVIVGVIYVQAGKK